MIAVVLRLYADRNDRIGDDLRGEVERPGVERTTFRSADELVAILTGHVRYANRASDGKGSGSTSSSSILDTSTTYSRRATHQRADVALRVWLRVQRSRASAATLEDEIFSDEPAGTSPTTNLLDTQA